MSGYGGDARHRLVKELKVKKILRFYFFAESLNCALDNLILKLALSPLSDTENSAERITDIITRKRALNVFWQYLDGVVKTMSEEDRTVLKSYCGMRVGLKSLGKEEQKAVKRAAVKFTRRARRIDGFFEEMRLVSGYYSLITCRDGRTSSFCP